MSRNVSRQEYRHPRGGGRFEPQNNFIPNSQFCHLAFAFAGEEGGGKLAGKLHRIDFVRSGEIGVCFTAHLAETVEDVKTIKKDKLGTILFFVEKKKRRRKKKRKRKEEREKSIA